VVETLNRLRQEKEARGQRLEPFHLITANNVDDIDYVPTKRIQRTRRQHIDALLAMPELLAWTTQNLGMTHPKLHPLPVGVANPVWPHGQMWMHEHQTTPTLHAATAVHPWTSRLKNDAKAATYVRFQAATHGARADALRLLKPQHFPEAPRAEGEAYVALLSSYAYAVSPRGKGWDTHRLWECVLCHTIPIVKDSPHLTASHWSVPMLNLTSWRHATAALNASAIVPLFGCTRPTQPAAPTALRGVNEARLLHNVVLVHTGAGENVTMVACVRQLRHISPTTPVYVVTDGRHVEPWTTEWASDPGVRVVDVKDIPMTKLHQRFNARVRANTRFRNGFWRLASQRFLLVHDLMERFHLRHTVHMENDQLVFMDVRDMLPELLAQRASMAYPCESASRGIGSVVYVRSAEDMRPFLEFMVSKSNRAKWTDMHALGEFVGVSASRKDARVVTLPITQPILQSEIRAPMVPSHWANWPCIFDAAVIGQYVGGEDRRNTKASWRGTMDTRGYAGPYTAVRASVMRLHWRPSAKGWRLWAGCTPVFNAHMHCKALARYASTNPVRDLDVNTGIALTPMPREIRMDVGALRASDVRDAWEDDAGRAWTFQPPRVSRPDPSTCVSDGFLPTRVEAPLQLENAFHAYANDTRMDWIVDASPVMHHPDHVKAWMFAWARDVAWCVDPVGWVHLVLPSTASEEQRTALRLAVQRARVEAQEETDQADVWYARALHRARGVWVHIAPDCIGGSSFTRAAQSYRMWMRVPSGHVVGPGAYVWCGNPVPAHRRTLWSMSSFSENSHWRAFSEESHVHVVHPHTRTLSIEVLDTEGLPWREWYARADAVLDFIPNIEDEIVSSSSSERRDVVVPIFWSDWPKARAYVSTLRATFRARWIVFVTDLDRGPALVHAWGESRVMAVHERSLVGLVRKIDRPMGADARAALVASIPFFIRRTFPTLTSSWWWVHPRGMDTTDPPVAMTSDGWVTRALITPEQDVKPPAQVHDGDAARAAWIRWLGVTPPPAQVVPPLPRTVLRCSDMDGSALIVLWITTASKTAHAGLWTSWRAALATEAQGVQWIVLHTTPHPPAYVPSSTIPCTRIRDVPKGVVPSNVGNVWLHGARRALDACGAQAQDRVVHIIDGAEGVQRSVRARAQSLMGQDWPKTVDAYVQWGSSRRPEALPSPTPPVSLAQACVAMRANIIRAVPWGTRTKCLGWCWAEACAAQDARCVSLVGT
jgi:hypothetical protein